MSMPEEKTIYFASTLEEKENKFGRRKSNNEIPKISPVLSELDISLKKMELHQRKVEAALGYSVAAAIGTACLGSLYLLICGSKGPD